MPEIDVYPAGGAPGRAVRGAPGALTFSAGGRRGLQVAWLILVPVLCSAQVAMDNIRLSHDGDDYLLSAQVSYELTEEVVEALEHGVALHLTTDIEVRRKRRWLWDPVIAELSLETRLEYHILSKQYLVTHLYDQTRRRYLDLEGALSRLGDIRDMPLVVGESLDPGADYSVRLRARLSREALPAPLHPLVYIEPQWRIASGWHELALRE